MKNGIVIFILWMVFVTIKGQEMDIFPISPSPSISIRDSLLDPFSLKAWETVKGDLTLRDSLYFFVWNSSLWEKVSSSLYSYNGNFNRISTTKRNWTSDTWENNTFYEYSYDDKGNREKMVEKSWNNGENSWINKEQRLYSFNEYQNLTGYVIQKWNEILSSWEDFDRYMYDYDTEQNWTYWEKQTWNPDSLKWVSKYRFLWDYLENILIKETRQVWNAIDLAWVNDVKDDYQYDLSGNLTNDTQSLWQSIDSTWEEKTIISFSYNPEGQVNEKLYRSWDVDILKNLALYTYYYSATDQLSEIIYSSWNAADWDTSYRYLFDYDAFGTLIRETDQQWVSGEENWLNEYKWEYYSTHYFDLLEAFISDSTNVSCFEYSNGTATVTISGGTPPYSILWNDPQNTTDPTVFGLSANQYYRVTVTDAMLNSVSDSVMLSQPPKIITGQIFGENIVEQNDTVTYRVESDTSSIYSWFVVNGQILFDQGGDTIIVVWTGSGQGEVSVMESTPNGCDGDTVHIIISISSTAIRENPSSPLRVYPNPASQMIYIQLEGGEQERWDIEVYDMTGKLVQSVLSITKSRVQIPLNNMRRGVYFFKISNSSGAVIRKVVVER